MAPPLLLPSPPPPSTETPQDRLSSSTRHPPSSSPSPSKHMFHFDPSALNSILQSLPSHPLLRPLFSLRLQYQNFVQVHLRIPRKQQQTGALSSCNFAAILPGDSVAGLVVANGLNNFLNLYNTLLVVRLVLTWFPNSPSAVVSPLSTICDPYLNIFRGIIPPLGGLDLSPILAFLVLNAFTSTAAALPAELPASQQCASSPPVCHNLTAMQEKWMRRLTSRFAKN